MFTHFSADCPVGFCRFLCERDEFWGNHGRYPSRRVACHGKAIYRERMVGPGEERRGSGDPRLMRDRSVEAGRHRKSKAAAIPSRAPNRPEVWCSSRWVSAWMPRLPLTALLPDYRPMLDLLRISPIGKAVLPVPGALSRQTPRSHRLKIDMSSHRISRAYRSRPGVHCFSVPD